jgi:hypothetical protein
VTFRRNLLPPSVRSKRTPSKKSTKTNRAQIAASLLGIDPEDKNDMFIRNIGFCSNYTVITNNLTLQNVSIFSCVHIFEQSSPQIKLLIRSKIFRLSWPYKVQQYSNIVYLWHIRSFQLIAKLKNCGR